MKKKYIRYRASLLIGLFSLNALSSCVNTRQELGMDGPGSQHIDEGRDNRGSLQEGGRVGFIRPSRYLWVRPLVRRMPDIETLLGLGVWFAAGYLYSSSKPGPVQSFTNLTTFE